MFRKKKSDKLIKAVEALRNIVGNNSPRKKVTSHAKHENFFADIYDVLTSPEHLPKEELFVAISTLFVCAGSSISSLQIQADVTLNKIFRVFWLKGQSQKTITLILNDLNESPQRSWKSIAVAYAKLAYYIRHARASKSRTFLRYYLNSIAAAVKRPEDGIQTSVEKTFPIIMKHLGPYLNELTSERQNSVFEVALKNLELAGSSGRVAGIIISELSRYHNATLEKAVRLLGSQFIKANVKLNVFLLANFSDVDENQNKRKVVNSLLALRLLWPEIVKNINIFSTVALQSMLLNVSNLLLSHANEILVATLEAFEVFFQTSTHILKFVPNELPSSSTASEYNTPVKAAKDDAPDEPLEVSPFDSPWGSVNDVSMDGPCYQNSANDSIAAGDDAVSEGFADNNLDFNDSFNDPLMHSVLASGDDLSILDGSLEDLSMDIESIFNELQANSFPVLISTIVSSRFLLKTSGCDDNLRISHKVLALKCLTKVLLTNGNLIHQSSPTTIRSFTEVFEFISHSDDKLAVAAFEFFAAVQQVLFLNGVKVDYSKFAGYIHTLFNGGHQMRVRGTLDVLRSSAELFVADDHVASVVLDYCVNLGWCAYFLVQCSRAELIAAINWKRVSLHTRSRYQNRCLESVIELLNNDDARIRTSAVAALTKFASNAMFDPHHDVLSHKSAMFEYSLQIQLDTLPSEPSSARLEHNISHILESLSDKCLIPKNEAGDSLATFVNGIDALLSTGHLTVLLNQWFAKSTLTEFRHSLILKLIESSKTCTTFDNLVAVMRVLAVLVEKKVEKDANTGQLKQLAASEVRMEVEVVLVYIRVLNLYYTIYVENMVKHKSSALPFFTPDSPSKQANTRSSDISHLVGTSIHQAKGGNYNDCHALKSLETSVQGSYKNFMESIDIDNEHRFLDPLCAAFTGLEKNLSKFTFEELKAFLDELLLYINKLMPFTVPQATGVLQELLKVLFGRNTVPDQRLLARSRSLSRIFDESNIITMCFSDLALYLTKLSSADTIEETLLNQFTNIYCRSPGSGSNLSFEVVAESLRRFEKPSAYLVSTAFFSNNCPKTRCKIIDFLSILLQEGVEYSMADPKRKIYEFVIAALQNPLPDVISVLANLLNFLIVLSMVDPTSIKSTDLEEVVITMYANLAADQADVGFPCISLLLLYNMTLNIKSISLIQKLLINNFDKWMALNPVKFLQLWTLLLCCARKDKKNTALYNELSDEFVHLYCAYHRNISNWKNILEADSNATIWATNAFFTCSQDAFTPIDDVYNFIKTAIDSDNASILYSTLPVMCSLSQLEEHRILLHLEALGEDAVDTVSTIVPRTWQRLIEHICATPDDEDGLQEKLIYASQVLLYYLRTGSHTIPRMREILLTDFDVLLVKQNRSKLQKSHIYIAATLVEAGHPDVGKVLDLDGCPSADQKGHLLQLTANLFMTDVKTFFDDEFLNSRLVIPAFASFLLRKPALNQKLLKRLTPEQGTRLIHAQFNYLKLYPLDGLIPQFWNSIAYCRQNGIAIPEELSHIPYSEDPTFDKLLRLHMVFLRRSFLNPDAPPDDSFLNYLVNAAQTFSSESEINGLASGALLLTAKEFAVLIGHFPQNRRHELINECIRSVQRLASEAVGVAHVTADSNDVERVQRIFDMLFSVASDLNLKVPTSTRQQLIAGLFEICKEPFNLKLGNINVDEFFLKCFAEPLVDTMLQHRRPNSCFYASLAAFFSFPSTIDKFTPDYDCLEMLEGFLLLLYKGLEKAIAPADSINTKLWDVQVSTVTKSEAYRDDIINLFFTVQKLSWLIQRREFVSFVDSPIVERCLKAICRLPLLTAMFVIPEVALCKSWTLKIDARADRISVPLVNIYILEDPDVLCNFCYRTLWLGWNVRSQFENYCTSLFGVLSTTPVGNELQVNAFTSEEKLYASIVAVSIAVETISNLLIQSVLYPQPGNPVISLFPTKHRESTGDRPFLESKRGRQAAAAKCQLLHNLAPTAAFKESFEKVTDDNTYGIGQSSLLYLWSMTSVLEHGSGSPDRVMQASASLQQSVSDYMLMQSTDLDTASTLRALLDNFEHWFTKSTMPMTLRISVLKSLCFLTDFLDDTKVYHDIYKSVKRILEEYGVGDAAVDGLSVFLVLKCVAVLGANTLDEDGQPGDTLKFIDATVINGLESNNIVVQQYTLQGMLYILQSYMLDELPNCLFSIKELVSSELHRLCITSDVATKGDFICASYEQILWAISFRFLEEAIPIDDRYKADFLGLVSKLYADPRLSSLQKRFLTSGIESLIVHSNTYNAQLLPTILDCLSTCQLQPLHIRSTVSSYIICIYKDLYKNENKKDGSSQIVDFNRLINVIAAFSTQSIAQELSTIISFILTSTMPPVSLIDNITVLITVPGFKPDAAPPLLQAFDSAMLEIYARSLMAARRQSKPGSADLFVKHIAPRLAMISNAEYAAFLIALSLVSGTCLTDASLWSSVLRSAFSHKRQLRPALRQLPSLLDQFVAITSERKTITTIAAALELFSLETDDGKNFRQNRERVKNLL
uniref:HEAT repeat-containing protein 1 n=1 Tax=Panagrellus redivivus TaxID=6233 RepID=A0A7E4W7A6_PANRE